ncbi:hypothetical protein FHS40_005511 [Streptomyces spectabilis]|uniref:Uncharacterized protein n=1 Tax=Streptomyces spectabilis TaxID=68270 RepID=A0A5P2X750_STRST|nr:hypothetical protein [Streptomyces spectabilis]MBB5106407.1 hypothetical protein [Streptomyces spectabilis]MCI3903016.1 hypothetical protein [Streptomyces spectabilis]QEV60271.1 hypothetical protein CP982_17350 [Streptomyces spectabilis]
MHPDVHLFLHEVRAAELRRATAPRRPPRAAFRTQLGWTMVELGLRLVSSSGPSRPSAGPAARRPYRTAW